MSMNNQPTDVELEETERLYWVEQAQALERLEDNKDFQKVILDGYFKDRALDQVSLLGTEYIKQNGKRPEVMEILVAISTLQDHFATIKNIGAAVYDDMYEDE